MKHVIFKVKSVYRDSQKYPVIYVKGKKSFHDDASIN